MITTIDQQVKSRKRIADHGEVFTNKREVNAMLDLVKQETERIDSRFLEPACGTGNFMVEILRRKLNIVITRYKRSQLEYERYAVVAISSIYGIDLLEDNVGECRKRLFDIFDEQYTKVYSNKCKESCRKSVKFILSKNIIRGDALTLKTSDNGDDPIVFSEWSLARGSMIKRRDYTLANLLERADTGPLTLFSYSGEDVYPPTPIKEFPLINFLRLGEHV